MMTPTLYAQHPKACAELERRGYLGIVGMAKIMHKSSEVARALGLSESGTGPSKWFTSANSPSFASDQKARDWLAKHASPAPILPASPPEEKPTEAKKSLLLVTCAPAERKRVEKVLAMLDCEVVEV